MAEEKLLWALLGGGIFLFLLLKFLRPAPAPTAAPPPAEVQRRIWEQIEAPPVPTPVPVAPTNACGATQFGYPDFTGTPRAGQPAVDQLDCINHPPFPGATNFCAADGTCY